MTMDMDVTPVASGAASQSHGTAPHSAARKAARRLAASPVMRRSLGLLDALATPHGIDRYLELVDPMLAVRELRGEVVAVTRATSDTVTLTVAPTSSWSGFVAGQFVSMTIEIDGFHRTRCYSPANSQLSRDGLLEFTIKADPEGIVSPYLVKHAHVGMIFDLAPAAGNFVLPLQRPEQLLLVSGGSGITPVLSMLRTLVDEGHGGEIVFLHYAYNHDSVPYREELAELASHPNVRVVYALTEAEDGDLAGFFSVDHLDSVAPWYADAQTYVCGPPGLMRAVREFYTEINLMERLHVEEFTPEVTVNPEEATGQVTFADSGVTVDNDGQTLLLQAEQAGLTPEYGCRMGICFSCTQIKSTGSVRNVLTNEVTDDPDEQIQLCLAVPLGDVSLKI